MHLGVVLLVAVLVVLVVLIVWAAVRSAKESDAARKDRGPAASHTARPARAWAAYRRAGGAPRPEVHQILQQAEAPTAGPAEHLAGARALTRGLQEEAPRAAGGAPERAQARRELFENARAHLFQAVEAIPPPGGGPRGPEAVAEHRVAAAVLDAAMNFAWQGARGLFGADDARLAGDAQLARMLQAQEAAGWGGAPGDFAWGGGAPLFFGGPEGALFFPDFAVGFVDAPLAQAAAARHADVVEDRRRLARAAAAAPGAAADAYVALATQHTADPQNTHDPGVLASLRAIVQRLRADQGREEQLPSVAQVIEELEKAAPRLAAWQGAPRPARAADALAVARRTAAGERAAGVGATDGECLRRVWARAADPRNAGVAEQLRQALFDGLADSWEASAFLGGGRHITCVNGRLSRILGALTLLDWDPRNWEVDKQEELRNEVFARARELIEAEARAAAAGGDPGLARAGAAVLARTAAELRAAGAVPPEAAAALEARTRERVAALVDGLPARLAERGLEGVFSPAALEALKAEALAAVG